jgi:hypothetical protein
MKYFNKVNSGGSKILPLFVMATRMTLLRAKIVITCLAVYRIILNLFTAAATWHRHIHFVITCIYPERLLGLSSCTYFNLLIYRDIMTICPECEKEFAAPKISFQTGHKPGGEKFEYAVCSCSDCDKWFGVLALPLWRIRSNRGWVHSRSPT